MTALARVAVRRLWGPPAWGAPATALTEHFQIASHSSGKRMRTAHAQRSNYFEATEAPLTAAAAAGAAIFAPSLFAPPLQTDIPASVRAESCISRLLQMLRLQQQQQQQQLQHEARGWMMSSADRSGSSSSSSSSRWTAAHHNLPGFALPLLLDRTIPHLAPSLPSSKAVQVYSQLQQAAVGEEDACGASVHAQCVLTETVGNKRLRYYCWNRNPSSRYPKRANNGARPKCRVMRKLRKRLRTGR
ncbi:hypothetical protein Emag_004111 [Eimeria magna]